MALNRNYVHVYAFKLISTLKKSFNLLISRQSEYHELRIVYYFNIPRKGNIVRAQVTLLIRRK